MSDHVTKSELAETLRKIAHDWVEDELTLAQSITREADRLDPPTPEPDQPDAVEWRVSVVFEDIIVYQRDARTANGWRGWFTSGFSYEAGKGVECCSRPLSPNEKIEWQDGRPVLVTFEVGDRVRVALTECDSKITSINPNGEYPIAVWGTNGCSYCCTASDLTKLPAEPAEPAHPLKPDIIDQIHCICHSTPELGERGWDNATKEVCEGMNKALNAITALVDAHKAKGNT